MANTKHNLTVVRKTITKERTFLKKTGKTKSNIDVEDEEIQEITCKCGKTFDSEAEGLRHLRNPEPDKLQTRKID